MTAPIDVLAHREAVRYWVRSAREQSRWHVQLRRAYRDEAHAKKRGRLYDEGTRCRDRIRPFMVEARRIRAVLANVSGGGA